MPLWPCKSACDRHRSVQTGEEFANAVRLLVAKHKPDLVWLDPLLSFIGDDISSRTFARTFAQPSQPDSARDGRCVDDDAPHRSLVRSEIQVGLEHHGHSYAARVRPS